MKTSVLHHCCMSLGSCSNCVQQDHYFISSPGARVPSLEIPMFIRPTGLKVGVELRPWTKE